MRVVTCLRLCQDFQLDQLVVWLLFRLGFLRCEWSQAAVILLGRCPCLSFFERQGELFQTRRLLSHAAPERLVMPFDHSV